MDLYLAIREAIKLQGDAIVIEKKMINILSDLHCFSSASNRSFKHIFEILYSSNCMNEIYSIWKSDKEKNESQIRFEIQRMAHTLSIKYALIDDHVNYCLENVFYALNLIPFISIVLENNTNEHSQSIIGVWDFHYRDNKEMKLEIRRDGFALASSGTKYQWSYSNEEFVLYIVDYVYYKGLLKNETLKGVAYSCYNPLGWEWFATRRNDGLTIDNLKSGTWIIENDVSDLEDNYIQFFPNNVLNSSLYGSGEWFLSDNGLKIITANSFITYEASYVKGKIVGKGRNKLSNEWNFELKKQQ